MTDANLEVEFCAKRIINNWTRDCDNEVVGLINKKSNRLNK